MSAPTPSTDDLAVAIDVTPLVGPRTGIGNFVAELLGALDDVSDTPRMLPYVLSRRADLSGGALPPRTRRLPIPARMAVRWWGRFDFPAFDGRLGPAAVVHGTNFVVPPSRRRTLVVTVHDCGFVTFPEWCSPDARGYAEVVRRAVGRGAWVHTPTDAIAGEVRAIFDTDRVRTVAHGVPALSDDSTPSPVAGPFILGLGTLEPRKQPALLVEAFALLAPDHPDLRLVIAGRDGPARPSVDAALSRLPGGLADRVDLLGHVDAATRTTLLRHAEALVQVSRYEGFGLPVLEAMKAGAPVVTTGAGGAVAEVAGDAAVLVSDDPAEIAEGVRRVLADDAVREHLVARGRHRAGLYTWPEAARRFVDLYREVAGA